MSKEAVREYLAARRKSGLPPPSQEELKRLHKEAS